MEKSREENLKDLLFGSFRILFSNGQLFVPLILLSLFKVALNFLPMYSQRIFQALDLFDNGFVVFTLFDFIIRFLLYCWIFAAIGTIIRKEQLSIFKQIPSALRVAKTGFFPIVSLYAIGSFIAWVYNSMLFNSQHDSYLLAVNALKILMFLVLAFLGIYAAVIAAILILTGMGGWTSLERGWKFLFAKKYVIIKALLISFGLYCVFVVVPSILAGSFLLAASGDEGYGEILLGVVGFQFIVEIPLMILIGTLLIFYAKIYAKESADVAFRGRGIVEKISKGQKKRVNVKRRIKK